MARKGKGREGKGRKGKGRKGRKEREDRVITLVITDRQNFGLKTLGYQLHELDKANVRVK